MLERGGGGRPLTHACSCVWVGRSLYIFGGRSLDGVVLNDVWCLDVERWAWVQLPSTTAPPPARLVACGVRGRRGMQLMVAVLWSCDGAGVGGEGRLLCGW